MNPENTVAVMNGFGTLPVVRQVGLLVGLAISIALGVSVVLWSMDPNYRPLYSNMNSRDAGQIIDILQQSGIQYKLSKNNGTILVDSDDIHDARIKLAAEGLPRGAGNGLEFLSKSGGLGGSQFIESARYRHALEAELARTITSFRNIKSARVHLALPKQAIFLRDNKQASASVFIDVYSGASLSHEKVAAIVHLVASSIPNLDSDKVTVVDNTGKLLSEGGGDSKMAQANRLLSYREQVENNYVSKIQGILEPLLGSGKIKARVSADIDFTSSEQTRESFNPDLPALRSEQIVVENSGGSSRVGGVAGAASNKPSTAKLNSGTNATGGSGRQQAIKNYELDKTISHTKQQVGRIRRLTVAVVVDDKATVDKKSGETKYVALSKEELSKITTLVRDAIGFNKTRGDSVNVINSSFTRPVPVEAIPAASFYQQSWFWEIIKQIIAGIFILILIFYVLNPILKYLVSRPSPEMMIASGGGGAGMEGASQGGDSLRLPGKLQSHHDRMQVVQGMAMNDPKRVAQVVKNWVDN